ncbi:MAG: beta-ketoacyl-[acyl-carrier-protein] synthase II [Myxococcales bacterium]|nr:beta-ketoacyl-[acyl-carrier-protein] synthase II [Myxococcales bacterium]
MTRAVVVTGVGTWSPLGRTWAETRAALARGATAVAPVTAWDATGFPCQVAAAIALGDGADEDRRRPLALAALAEAWGAGRVDVAPARLGVFLGAESGRASFATVLALARAAGGGTRFDAAAFAEAARPFAARLDARAISPAAIAAAIALEVGAAGPVATVSLACASGAAAIVDAVRAIRAGACDVAICGGVGADVEPLMLAGFGLLGALSARGVSCPFDARRDGFVVGEGAALLVLAAADVAGGRGEVEVAGVGRSLDGYRLTAPEPDGDGAARAIAAALTDAGGPAIDYVQAHGTSTPLNDPAEIVALGRALGDGFARAYVSSVKGAVGHWVAGAGAIGALCAIEAVASGTIMPTAGLATPDASCGARHVLGAAVTAPVRAALVNAFAFGGANASLVVRRREGA